MQEPEHYSSEGQRRPGEGAPHLGHPRNESPPLPLEERVRRWHHWRTGGILTSVGGVAMIIGGALSRAGLAMEFGGFFMLSGAVIFTVGVIGGWLTQERPLE